MKEKDDQASQTILAVDDIAENLDVIKATLTPKYRVIAAINGQMAVKIAENKKPDLILLDIVLPKMNGYEVCQQLKENPETRDIPIIFVTGMNSTYEETKGLELGAVDYIVKPINSPILEARVKTHLELSETKQELKKHRNYLEDLVQKKVKEISESKTATIYALAKLTESRDKGTGKHLERTQRYCRLLASKLQEHDKYRSVIDSEYCENIYKASPLHDIGKVGISDSILLKPDKLTKEEFEIIKTHTIIGAQTLTEVKEKYTENVFINMGIDIVRSHHEKWNGNGYPDGLAGEEIPLSARIMAIADVYDALRTKRPYKDSFSHEKSCEIIIRNKEKHFDPLLVEAFIALQEKFKAISTELKD
ncbi:HD domain-containing phosphohydrolase [Fuchsiella alkaliacetigena]|uniref:HD domain-containing phosphohydrolase n=1 Tax=Fuchsiella alkaliacetigena TaxID=957042 RepID=UPI00200A4014|nr:HD domain-containing phosphohydrolase [Fuchsiella alkaliacetigena]MCK8824055.1 response regulator [Fuchsiella alkaliacetigena]